MWYSSLLSVVLFSLECRTLLRLARQCLGEIVSACEFMDSLCMSSVNENMGLASPLEDDHQFYFLVSTSTLFPWVTDMSVLISRTNFMEDKRGSTNKGALVSGGDIRNEPGP